MAFILEVKEEASFEIVEAYLYYENKQKGLGDKFLEHLDIYFKRIISNPAHFPEKRKPYREAFIRRFPFIIIYEIVKEKIIVYSLFNTWKNPDKKKNRSSEKDL